MDDYHGGYASERWDDLLLWANLLSGKLHLTILLAPSGALVFIMDPTAGHFSKFFKFGAIPPI